MEINLQNKILKKKSKIKNLKEQNQFLLSENENLKQQIAQGNNTNEEIEALKNQILKYEKSLNDTSDHYEAQIESLQNKLNDYISYMNLINKFIKNISNDLNTSSFSLFNFDLNTNILNVEQFQSILNQIENFFYEIIKENSNLKVKYNKILDVNNKILSQNNNQNSFHSTTNNFSENVFENNYENNNKKEKDISSNLLPQDQIAIFKTLEQRVNLLEQELIMQKQKNNSVFHTVNANNKNDTIVKKVRAKSGNKVNLDQQNIPLLDKPKKMIKKKKKTSQNHNIITNNNCSNGKGSLCSNISHTNSNSNKNKCITNNRCITPVHSRKRAPSGNNSNINTNNNYKGNGCFIKRIPY